MPSGRPSRKPVKGCALLLGGISTAFLVLWILLLTGALKGTILNIVRHITRDADSQVSVYGGRSDLFSFTSVDSVVVTNDRGLKVGVYRGRVDGSVLDFLFRSSVESISVDSLVIITPEPSTEPPDSSLSPIFTGTMAGMVTRTGSITLDYGRVEDLTGLVLVDSMHLRGSIPDIESVTISVEEAGSLLPGLGVVEGSGILRVDSTMAALEDFTVTSPPGSLDVAGVLHSDRSVDFSFSGVLSTAFAADLPFASLNCSGDITGSISRPLVTLSIPEGCVNYDGLMVGFSADSIWADRERCVVAGFSARTGSVSAGISGDLAFADLSWNGTVLVELGGTDVSSYFPELPGSDITGSVNLSASGEGESLAWMEMNGVFSNTRVLEYSVPFLSLSCSGNTAGIQGAVDLSTDGGNISSDFSLSLGRDYSPVAWSADIRGFIADCGIFTPGRVSPLDGARGLAADIIGSGSMSSFTVSGVIQLASYRSDSIRVSAAKFSGGFSLGDRGLRAAGDLDIGELALSGSSEAGFQGLAASVDFGGMNPGTPGLYTVSGRLGIDSCWVDSIGGSGLELTGDFARRNHGYQAECSLMVAEAFYGSILADTLSFTGGVEQNGGISGRGTLGVISILLGENRYSARADFDAVPGSVSLDSLIVVAPGDLALELSGVFSYGPSSMDFSLGGIALTRGGKLRLISSGDLELTSDSTGVLIDTLWLDLPSGEITAEGRFTSDSMDVSARLQNVDIASFATMLGFSVPFSGVLEADADLAGLMGDLQSSLNIRVDHPTYDQWDSSDSLTVSLITSGDSLLIDGIWSWTDGIRSGARMGFDGIWDRSDNIDLVLPDLMWLEAELTGVGDELFYLLPIPLKTYGASVSARIEYQRDSEDFSAGIASHFDRLYLTNPGIEFPGLSLYMTYPDSREEGAYNGSLTFSSVDEGATTLEGSLLLNVREDLSFARGSVPMELRGYRFSADLNGWETLVAGVGWLKLSGSLLSQSRDIVEKPKITGKINIDAATISMGGGGAIEGSGGGSSTAPAELPLDLSIRISGERGIWFRNSYANVELSTQVDLSTVRGMLTVGGDVRAVRGGVYLLAREFRITQGEVRILQSLPLEIELDIEAETRIRSSVSGAEYTITVSVTGDPENPEIALSGTGPAGTISEQDMVTLLTAGMTYGELQQFDSTALGSVAGNYLGQWLARSIRDDVGLDALQFTPDFSSDTTSLVVNAGKYVLPDLFVSYSSDVFSSDAGTISAQYFFNRDFFLEGSTKSTLTGSHDPSLELHYTYRY